MASIFQGIMKGFGRVGSEIVTDQAELDAEEQSAIRKYTAQKRIDVDAQRELDEIEAKRLAAAEARAAAQFDKTWEAGYSPTARTQAAAVFDGASPTMELSPEVVADDSMMPPVEGEMPLVSAPASMVQPVEPEVAQGPTKEEVLLEFRSLPETTRLKDPNAYTIAFSRAKEKADKRIRRETSAEVSERKARIDAKSKGFDYDTGERITGESYWDLNKPYILQDAEERGLPVDESLVGTSFKRRDPKAWEAAVDARYKAFNSNGYMTMERGVENGLAQLEMLRDSVDNTKTGVIRGSQMGQFISKLTGDGSPAAAFSAIMQNMSNVPRNPGSISDYEAKNMASALAQLNNPKEANEQIVRQFLNSAYRMQQAMRFERSLFETYGPVDSTKARQMFDKWAKGNEMYIRNEAGDLVENKSRVGIEDWDWNTDSAKPQVIEDRTNKRIDAVYGTLNNDENAVANEFGF